jgi:hypothetical protein
VKRAPKYRAIRTEGIGPSGEPRTYDSKSEAAYCATLNLRKRAGEIVSWVPQVSLEVGTDEGGKRVRYRADAMLVLELRPDGSFVGQFVDRKGLDTPASRAKRAALRALHGISVVLT